MVIGRGSRARTGEQRAGLALSSNGSRETKILTSAKMTLANLEDQEKCSGLSKRHEQHGEAPESSQY